MAISVTIGSSAFGKACDAQDPAVGQALRPSRGDVVLRPGVDDRGSHEDRVRPDQADRDGGQGQDEAPPGFGQACDDLFDRAGLGTDYEAFAATCGQRTREDPCARYTPHQASRSRRGPGLHHGAARLAVAVVVVSPAMRGSVRWSAGCWRTHGFSGRGRVRSRRHAEDDQRRSGQPPARQQGYTEQAAQCLIDGATHQNVDIFVFLGQ